VHRSNFDIVGFTETPSVEELADVARSKKIPLLYDEGSGRVVDLSPYGFKGGETISELIAKGVDVVTSSTDKLMGATQGGLIVGREEILARCRRHPLMRALRTGKESYSVIGATLRAFATAKHEQRVPIYRMLATSTDELRARAAELTRGTRHGVVETRSALGGGTTPTQTVPSIGIAVSGDANELHGHFLEQSIIGRIVDEVFMLDLRTVLPEELPAVAEVLR
jgi:L-seryl-tRNA(Ser) seleniumtransferase